MNAPRHHLVLGGTRSGKSRHAETLADRSGLEVVYIATARPLDTEMVARIEEHRARRPADWRLVEEPRHLVDCLRRESRSERCLLVDCLALWLTQRLCEAGPERTDEEIAALIETVPTLPGRLVLVGNEGNMGMTPGDALSRRYADLAGRLHQGLASVCDEVVLVCAGLPLTLKSTTRSHEETP